MVVGYIQRISMKTAIKIICIVAVVALAATPQMAVAMRSSPDAEFERAMKNGAQARLEIRVVDDEGEPVSNATVKVLFNMLTPGGGEIVTAATDTNGVAVAEGKTNVAIRYRVEKDGYYKSEGGMDMYNMSHRYEVNDGKWQPWGMQKEVVLKPCKRRIPLIVVTKISETICTNRWYAIDFEKKDLVTPDGSGKVADLRFMIEWDGRKPSNAPSTALHIAFDGVRNGGCYADKQLQSEFPYVYQANTNDSFVLKTIDYSHWYDGKPGYGAWRGDKLEEDKSLVVRLRSNVDDEGKLLSANYANITRIKYGAGWDGKCWVSFSYFFNQIPNDPNLEP